MKHTRKWICALMLTAAAVPALAQDLTLSFDAGPTVTGTCEWTVDKTVEPESAELFAGDQHEVQWTVDVTFDGKSYTVSGTVEVTNTTAQPKNNYDLEICLDGSALACQTVDNADVAASGSNTHDFSFGPTQGGAGWTVTVELEHTSGDTDIESGVLTFDACSADVTDDSGSLGTATEAGFNTSYTETFSCDDDEGDNTNTANVGDDEDDATFALTCLDLTVAKTADASHTRTWNWTIDKEGDQTEVLLNTDTQTLDVNYDVEVDASGTDSDWSVSGDIDVTNPASYAVNLTDVTDVLDAHGAVVVACDDGAPVVFPYSLGAGATLGCTYDASPANGNDTENIAFATLENNSYTYLGVATADGTTAFSDTTAVSYSINHVDECVDVDDTLWDGNESPVVTDMTICAAGDPPDTLPHTFEYAYTIGPYTDFCDGATFSNTASFETNDSATTGDNDHDVAVTAECETDCVLGYGYWRNHSSYGMASTRDVTWDEILPSAEDTPFFLSGQTYHEVLLTNSSGGNAYYILSRHYISAELNFATGASVPTAVQDAFDAATALFNTYTPAQVLALKGKNGKETRAMFIDAAGVLGQYNSGFCAENPGVNGCPADVSDYPPYCTQEPEEDALAKAIAGSEAMSIPETDAQDVESVPSEYALSANYPNPFNPSTTISFQLPESSLVRLSVFDIQGREVARLVDGSMPAGTHNVQFSAGSLPSGLYVYTLTAGGNQFRKTMLLLK